MLEYIYILVKFILFLKEVFFILVATYYFIEWVKTKDYKIIFQEMIIIFIKEKTI
jgi:hypothetical protein